MYALKIYCMFYTNFPSNNFLKKICHFATLVYILDIQTLIKILYYCFRMKHGTSVLLLIFSLIEKSLFIICSFCLFYYMHFPFFNNHCQLQDKNDSLTMVNKHNYLFMSYLETKFCLISLIIR